MCAHGSCVCEHGVCVCGVCVVCLWCVCVVCVCVCVCVRVTSSRWRRGDHEVAGEDQQFLRFVGPPLVRTTLPPHPLVHLELAVGSIYPAFSGYGGRSTWRALTACFYGQGAQLPLTPGFSGVGLANPPLRQFLGLGNRTQATAWVLPYALF